MTAPARAAAPKGAVTAAVATELRAHMARQQVTGRELARRLHVSAQWISQRTRGVVPLDTDDMELIAGALGITVVELVVDAMRRVSQTTSGDQGGAVTGIYTAGYRPASSSTVRALSLVPPLAGGYGHVAECASDAHRYGDATGVGDTAGVVKNADAA